MREPGRRPDDERRARCVCELVGLLYASCRIHGKRARFALLARKQQIGRLRYWFPRTPTGVRYLGRDEVLRLADRMVEREARIQGREADITAKRCEP